MARSFSGDKTQLVPLIEAAIEHKGAAFIDVISPCVAFNNHAGSTKSFDYVREHNDAVNRLDVITGRDADHGRLRAGLGAGGRAARRHAAGARASSTPTTTCMTGWRRMSSCRSTPPRARWSPGCSTSIREAEDLHAHLNTVDAPLNGLDAKDLCPGTAALEKINASLR